MNLIFIRNKQSLHSTAIFWLTFLVFTFQSETSFSQISLSKPLIEKWQYTTDVGINFTPVISSENLLVPLTNGDLVSLSWMDGSFNWKSQIGGNITARPISDDQGAYVASSSLKTSSFPDTTAHADGSIRKISNISGVTIWIKALDETICGGIASNDSSVFGSTAVGNLYAIEKKSGTILWNTTHRSLKCAYLSILNDRLYYGNEASEIVSVELNTGKEIWRYQTHSGISTPLVFGSKNIYWGTLDNYFCSLDQRTKSLKWCAHIGTSIQSITPTQKGLLVIGMDNSAIMFSYQKGAKIWKRLLTGRIVPPPLVLGSEVLLASLVGGECIILDVNDGKKLNSLSLGADAGVSLAPLAFRDLLLITTSQKIIALTGTLPSTNRQ